MVAVGETPVSFQCWPGGRGNSRRDVTGHQGHCPPRWRGQIPGQTTAEFPGESSSLHPPHWIRPGHHHSVRPSPHPAARPGTKLQVGLSINMCWIFSSVVYTGTKVHISLLHGAIIYKCSNRPLKKSFKLTNKGRRHQQLVWSMDGFGPVGKARKDLAAYNPLDMKYRVSRCWIECSSDSPMPHDQSVSILNDHF